MFRDHLTSRRLSKPALGTIGAFMVAATTAGTAIPTGLTGKNVSHDAKLRLYFASIPVGRLKFGVAVSDGSYSVSGTAVTSGVGKLFSNTVASFSSGGVLPGTRPTPTSHNLNYKTKKKTGSVRMKMASGKIISSASVPKVKYKPGTVPVKLGELANILDPASALVIPVRSGSEENGSSVCNRTLPLFDGKNRFNLKLSFKRVREARTEGFSGNAYTCSVRYQPIAGHRPHKDDVKRLKRKKDIEITLARISGTNVYTLYGFSVPTRFGTASGSAYKFETR